MRKFGPVQQVVEDFYQSDKDVMIVPLLPRTYASINSAWSAYRKAIKSLGYNIAIRNIHNNLYLIKIYYPKQEQAHEESDDNAPMA